MNWWGEKRESARFRILIFTGDADLGRVQFVGAVNAKKKFTTEFR